MQIGGVMRTNLVTASPEQTAAEAIRTMVDAGVGSVVVTEGNEPVGIFTERDVLRLAGAGADFGATRLGDVMTRNPKTVSGDQLVSEALELLNSSKIMAVIVVENGTPIGIVHLHDLLRAGVA